MTGYDVLKFWKIMKMSDKAIELQGVSLLTLCLKPIMTLEHISNDEHGTIMAWNEKGMKAGIFSRKPGNSEEIVLSFYRQTCQLWGFLKKRMYKPFACMVMRGWLIRWLYAYFKQIWSWALFYWAELPDETHGSVMRIWVNTAPVLWAPHGNIHSNSPCCVHNVVLIIMFRDLVFRNCTTVKSQYIHPVKDSGKIQNLNQFTFNNEIGTFMTQKSVKIYDFHNTRYQHFVHIVISALKPACKCRVEEKQIDLKFTCPS